MIEIERHRRARRRRHDGAHIGEDAVLADALVIEGRQHERAREAQFRRMARQGDGVPQGRSARPHHHALAIELACGGAHQREPVAQGEGGRLAGGAQHIEGVAAVV